MQGNKFCRDPSKTFLGIYLYPAIGLVGYYQIVLQRNQTQHRCFQRRLGTNFQCGGVNGCQSGSYLLGKFYCFVASHTVLGFYITGYGTGRNLIPAVLFGNEETNGIVIQFTDDLTFLTGQASYIYIIIHLCDYQILEGLLLGCFRGGIHLIVTDHSLNNAFNLFRAVGTCGKALQLVALCQGQLDTAAGQYR